MALMRLKTLAMSRHIVLCFRPATTAPHMRWFANDAKNGPPKKPGAPNNNASVNKNILSARKKPTNVPDPVLTIYPQDFALPKLKNKYSTAKPIVSNQKPASKVDKGTQQAKVTIDGSNQAKQQQVPNKSNVKPQEILQACTPDGSQTTASKPPVASSSPSVSSPPPTSATTPQSSPPPSSATTPQSSPLSSTSSTPPPSIPPQSQVPPSSLSQAPPSASSPNNNKWWIALLAAVVGGGVFYYLRPSDDDETSKDVVKPSAPIVNTKIPATSAEIPKEVPYLLIGGGTASFAAFRAIKSHDPKAKVLVISNENETPYMRPPLSKELWLSDESSAANGNVAAKTTSTSGELKFKQWNGVERSLYYEPNDFYIHPSKLLEEVNGGVAVVRGYAVAKVDVSARTAILTDGTTIKYGECLLATGSSPKNLEVFERAPRKVQDKCSVFKNIEDYERLKKVVDESKSIAIIGGGFLGSELACALAKYGEPKKLKVHQIFHEKGNMGKVLPEFLSKWTTERVREEGVNVIPNTQVQSAELINGQLNLKLIDGKSVLCDHAVVAVGSAPNVTLAQESGLEVDSTFGGYLVNAELEARRHLYVAGDAACFFDPKLGRRRVEHHDHAVVSGRLAGENMVGLKKPYTHQSMFWSDLGPKVGYEAIGVIDSSLPTVSVFAKHEPKGRSETSDATAAAAGSETNSPDDATKTAAPTSDDDKDDFGKGVVFYLRDDKIIGIVLWNVFNRINTARAVIGESKKFDDLNEVAKLFDIHT